MSILSIFKPLRKGKYQRWKELGCYQSTFSVFGSDAYNSAIVRSCIRPLADLTSKAEAKCEDKQLERMLNSKPNIYMDGCGFLYKLRTRYELLNTAFIFIERDERMKVIGLYPVPYSYFEALEYNNGLFLKFYFTGNLEKELIIPWEDLVPLRKDYNKSDIAGDDNSAIIATLQLMQTIDEGLKNGIRATANLRGILKSTKAMLAPEAIRAAKEEFVKDYLNLENSGGIAALDSTQEFTPITMNPLTANAEQRKETREDIYRYFGSNDKIIMADIKTEELENYYKIRIEPFYIALSRGLTAKIYSGKTAAYEKNKITYIADQGQFMTISQKLELFSKVVLYGGMTKNEWRHLLGYPDIEGGDIPIMRLDADYINIDQKPRQGNESDKSKVAPVQQNEEEDTDGSEE